MSTKVRLGLGWLVIAAICLLVLLFATSGVDGVEASDGERLAADLAGIATAVTGGIGLLLLLSELFGRK